MRGDYDITIVHGAELSDHDIAQSCELNNVINAEILPDDPPTPTATAIARTRALPERIRRISVRAKTPDGSLVGISSFRIDPEHDDNPDMLMVSCLVHPEHRRKGVATRLLSELVTLARAEGRSRMIGETFAAVPAGPAFAEAVGGEVKARQHLNHLPVPEIDRALMDAWVKEGPVRAAGYELVAWDGPTPEEHLEQFANIVLVMNSAPRDDLEMNDFTLTPEMVREMERQIFQGGLEMWTIVARRSSDGGFAGLHNVAWEPNEPENVYVHMTGVQPEDRGHALGKWLKAVMTLRILDERPGVTDIRTGNADSNEAMLGINRQMGYRPLVGADVWEVSVDTAAGWLASHGTE
jgi:GNAT superfamily N-acetyltransferase